MFHDDPHREALGRPLAHDLTKIDSEKGSRERFSEEVISFSPKTFPCSDGTEESFNYLSRSDECTRTTQR